MKTLVTKCCKSIHYRAQCYDRVPDKGSTWHYQCLECKRPTDLIKSNSITTTKMEQPQPYCIIITTPEHYEKVVAWANNKAKEKTQEVSTPEHKRRKRHARQEMIIKKCRYCGMDFKCIGKAQIIKKKYCSNQCCVDYHNYKRDRSQRPKEEPVKVLSLSRICLECKKPFNTTDKRKIFCQPACGVHYHTKAWNNRRAEKLKEQKTLKQQPKQMAIPTVELPDRLGLNEKEKSLFSKFFPNFKINK